MVVSRKAAGVKFLVSQWNPEAELLLAGAAGNDPTYTLADLKREISSGHATLYAVMVDGMKVGYAVLWIEDFGRTKELVIQAGEAFGSNRDAFKRAIPALKQFAQERGCLSMRSHSNDPRNIGLLKSNGFRKAEVVMRQSWW